MIIIESAQHIIYKSLNEDVGDLPSYVCRGECKAVFWKDEDPNMPCPRCNGKLEKAVMYADFSIKTHRQGPFTEDDVDRYFDIALADKQAVKRSIRSGIQIELGQVKPEFIEKAKKTWCK